MSHSPFPYYIDPHVPTAVFDANGWKFAATTPGQMFPEIDPETAADNAALIAAIPAMVEALENIQQRAGAVATWLNHWDVPFADQDEWRGPTGDGQLFFNALNKAAAVLASIGKTP